MKEKFPSLLEPLNEIDGRDFLIFGKNKLFDREWDDKEGKFWIGQVHDDDPSLYRYWVTDRLVSLYELFGEEYFVKFFETYHNIFLKGMHDGKTDWNFI